MMKIEFRTKTLECFLGLILLINPAYSSEWSVNEVQLQQGNLKSLSFLGGEKASTTIVTFQHASGWQYGDNFFFLDRIDDNRNDGFNDKDWYGEWYTNFSLGKIRGKAVATGPLKDIGFVMGFNWAADADVTKYLPGVSLSWDIPGFKFFNTLITAYIDDSDGVAQGGAPAEDNSWMIDNSFAYPFNVGSQSFSIEGHFEYIGSRDNEFGNSVASWILAQPQVRWDIGEYLFSEKDKMFVGIEYQYWKNKLGDKETDESVVQFLWVVRL